MISFLGKTGNIAIGQLGKPPKKKIGNLHNSYVYHDIFVVKESLSKRKMTTPPWSGDKHSKKDQVLPSSA